MIAEDTFAHVVQNVYRAAVADVTWVSAAASIDDMIGAHGHSLTYAQAGTLDGPVIHMARFFVGAERRQDLEQSYFRNYFRRDEAIPRLYGLRDGELVHKADLYTDREKRMSAAYNEFRRAQHTQNGLFLGIETHDGSGVVMSFGNSVEREGWGNDQIQAIQRLVPHIRQFVRVRRAMVDAKALGASLSELLENRRTGFIQIDRRGRILEANDRARDILLKRDGLRDEEGVLAAEDHEEHAKLQRLVAQALPRYGMHGAGASMRITRRQTRTPLVLEVHPVRRLGMDHPGAQLGALVVVVDPARRPRVDPVLAAEVLGLTPMESRVAVAILAGQTAAGTANTLGCAKSTVKTHLKRVYGKLGITKQTELARRLLVLDSLREPHR